MVKGANGLLIGTDSGQIYTLNESKYQDKGIFRTKVLTFNGENISLMRLTVSCVMRGDSRVEVFLKRNDRGDFQKIDEVTGKSTDSEVIRYIDRQLDGVITAFQLEYRLHANTAGNKTPSVLETNIQLNKVER